MQSKTIRICKKCGNRVIKSDLKQYEFQCLFCDEDLFEFETELKKIDNIQYKKNNNKNKYKGE